MECRVFLKCFSFASFLIISHSSLTSLSFSVYLIPTQSIFFLFSRKDRKIFLSTFFLLLWHKQQIKNKSKTMNDASAHVKKVRGKREPKVSRPTLAVKLSWADSKIRLYFARIYLSSSSSSSRRSVFPSNLWAILPAAAHFFSFSSFAHFSAVYFQRIVRS